MNIKELNEAIAKALNESTDVVSFNDLDELEDYIRKEHDFPDNFVYNNACYTMDEYDMEGYTITYASCDNEQGIRVETPDNRYDKNTDYVTMDINIEEYKPFGLRKDINYLSIDGNNYGIIDSDKDGIVWSKATDCFSIAVYNKFAKEDYEDAWVDLGKRKNDNKYTVYIKNHGLFDTLPEEVNNKEEAIEVVKKYLLNKLDIKDENNAVVKVKTFNESLKPSKIDKKAMKEGTGIFHGETLAKVPKEEWVGKIITVPYDKADYEIVGLDDEDNMAVLKNIKTGETARMGYKGLQNPLGYMYYLQGTGIEESFKQTKSTKKAMKESVNSIDSIVNSVVIKVNDSFDGTVDKDDLIHEFADDYLGNFDDVIDLFKEIHFNRSDLYDEILRSVSEEIEDRVREKLSDI